MLSSDAGGFHATKRRCQVSGGRLPELRDECALVGECLHARELAARRKGAAAAARRKRAHRHGGEFGSRWHCVGALGIGASCVELPELPILFGVQERDFNNSFRPGSLSRVHQMSAQLQATSAVTKAQSQTLVRNLLRTALSSISSSRGLFGPDQFTTMKCVGKGPARREGPSGEPCRSCVLASLQVLWDEHSVAQGRSERGRGGNLRLARKGRV